MKQLSAVLVLIVAAFVLYRMHETSVKKAASEAAEVAAARANTEAAARMKAEALRSKVTTPRPPALKAVAISRSIEPQYQELFSDLNSHHPADLVPALEITRERILDKQQHVEVEKHEAYTAGINLIKAMVAVAEIRTQKLQALLDANARPAAALDGRTTTTTSSFFAQTTARQWDAERQRRKPALDQLFANLRQKEREWNKRAGENAQAEDYDIPIFQPVFVSVDPVAVQNPLERRAYDQKRAVYPWRSSYYTQYGYRGY
jgi:hypothetical protein